MWRRRRRLQSDVSRPDAGQVRRRRRRHSSSRRPLSCIHRDSSAVQIENIRQLSGRRQEFSRVAELARGIKFMAFRWQASKQTNRQTVGQTNKPSALPSALPAPCELFAFGDILRLKSAKRKQNSNCKRQLGCSSVSDQLTQMMPTPGALINSQREGRRRLTGRRL